MAPARYRFVIEGELGPRYSTAFDDMEVQPCGGSTVLVGEIRDQAHLRGVLERVAMLGLNLVSAAPDVRRVPDTDDSPG